ncbi:MAG: glycosyltransferase family 2 protein [Candidatus Methanomethylicaceae archaeon]
MWGIVSVLCLSLIVYTYLVYPAAVITIARRKKARNCAASLQMNKLPTVSFIVSVYNEEKSIEGKVINTLQINYPPELIEFIFVSDGSTDRTNEILEQYIEKGVQVYCLPNRVGKTKAQEFAIERARGEVLVFSDASTQLEPESVRCLVQRLQDPTVGLVSGEDEWLLTSEHRASVGQGLYVRYEMAIRKSESEISTATASSGCFYAVRRELRPLLSATLIDDFATPLAVIEKGFRVVTETQAKCYVPMTSSERREFSRKVRIVAGGVYALWIYRRLLNPFRYGIVAWQLWSHKVLRWAVPFVAIVMLLSSVVWATVSVWGKGLVLVELLFGISALMGWQVKGKSKLHTMLRAAFFLVMSNYAVLLGVIHCMLHGSPATWEPSRR